MTGKPAPGRPRMGLHVARKEGSQCAVAAPAEHRAFVPRDLASFRSFLPCHVQRPDAKCPSFPAGR